MANACTGSSLECANRVAGVKLMPVPRSLNGRLLECANCSGAVSVRPVPFAPGVPTDATVTVSFRDPMSRLILAPGVMPDIEFTLMTVSPAAAGAASKACSPAVPTLVTVAVSSFWPKPIVICSPTLNPPVLVTGTFVELFGIVIGPSGSGCHSGVLGFAEVVPLMTVALLPLPEESIAVGPEVSSNL